MALAIASPAPPERPPERLYTLTEAARRLAENGYRIVAAGPADWPYRASVVEVVLETADGSRQTRWMEKPLPLEIRIPIQGRPVASITYKFDDVLSVTVRLFASQQWERLPTGQMRAYYREVVL